VRDNFGFGITSLYKPENVTSNSRDRDIYGSNPEEIGLHP